MPYEIAWEPNAVVKTYSGFLNHEDFVKSIEETISDDRFGDIRFVINDLLEVKGHDINEDDISYVGAISLGSKPVNANVRILLVAVDDAVTNLADIIARPQHHNPYGVKVFPTAKLAREWINTQALADGNT